MEETVFNYENIEVSIQEGYAEVVLSREKSLNSLNTETHKELLHCLATLEGMREGVRALILTGRGRAFCAGQDLEEVKPDPNGRQIRVGDLVRSNYVPLMQKVKDLQIPTVCAVNGVAAGAGASLALACDVIIAAKSARFLQAFSKIGLTPDSGGTWLLPRLVGRARALDQFFTAEAVDSTRAFELGMVSRVVEDERLTEESRTVARQLAKGPTMAYIATRRAVDLGYSMSFSDSLILESLLQDHLGESYDYREGVAAFLEKRPARFEGR